MKQVFECGIVGESNDEVGDCFLGRLAEIRMPDTTSGRLPNDFTIGIPERDLMLNGPERYAELCQAMIARGYETLQWRDIDKWCECIRFRRINSL